MCLTLKHTCYCFPQSGAIDLMGIKLRGSAKEKAIDILYANTILDKHETTELT